MCCLTLLVVLNFLVLSSYSAFKPQECQQISVSVSLCLSMIKKVGWVSRSCRIRDSYINKTGSQLAFDQPAFDRPATRTRHAHAGLRLGQRPGLRLDSVIEFGL